MAHFNLSKLKEIPAQLEHRFFSKPQISGEQVVEKLSAEINTLHDWLINFGDHFGSATFFEKSRLLVDKIAEREELEKLLEKAGQEEIN